MKNDILSRRSILLGGSALAAGVAAYGYSTMTAVDPVVAPVTSVDFVGADGVKMGTRRVFTFANVIDLESDRGNLSTPKGSFVQLPPGYVIEEARFKLHKKKHTVKYGLSISQPNSVSISQESVLKISASADSAVGAFSGKRKIKLAGELKTQAESLAHSYALDATSHARVKYHGWADGRKYSSRDGVIKASLIVTARRVPLNTEVNAELAKIAIETAKANQSIMVAAIKALKNVKAAAKKAKV